MTNVNAIFLLDEQVKNVKDGSMLKFFNESYIIDIWFPLDTIIAHYKKYNFCWESGIHCLDVILRINFLITFLL